MMETYGTRIAIAGPEVEIDEKAAQHFALAVHELATNAVKHGSLSTADGRVEVSWETTGDAENGAGGLVFHWRESGPPVTLGGRVGFGTKLLTLAVPEALRGAASRTMEPEGLTYELRVPLRAISPRLCRDVGGPLTGPLPPPATA